MGFFDKVVDTVSAAGKNVADKTKNVADIAGLSHQVSAEEGNIRKLMEEIGRKYYDAFRFEPPAGYEELFDKVAKATENAEELKKKLRDAKGIKLCENCGAEVDKNSAFCGRCGTKIVFCDAEAEVVEESPAELPEEASSEESSDVSEEKISE